MSPSERREMIRKENTDLSLTRQCKLLRVSRSSIYYTPVGFDQVPKLDEAACFSSKKVQSSKPARVDRSGTTGIWLDVYMAGFSDTVLGSKWPKAAGFSDI